LSSALSASLNVGGKGQRVIAVFHTLPHNPTTIHSIYFVTPPFSSSTAVIVRQTSAVIVRQTSVCRNESAARSN
jgi:hypothetical protein